MGSKSKGGSAINLNQSYEDFEPFCKWDKEASRHTLVLHLLEFKKQQLRVQVNNSGVVTITGERSLDDSRISRFRKETKIPTNVNSNEIRAKFSCGILYVIMPLKCASLSKETGGSKVHVDQQTGIENSADRIGGGREKRVATRFAALCKPTVGMKSLVCGMRMDAKVAVAVAVVVVAVVGGWLGYKLRFVGTTD